MLVCVPPEEYVLGLNNLQGDFRKIESRLSAPGEATHACAAFRPRHHTCAILCCSCWPYLNGKPFPAWEQLSDCLISKRAHYTQHMYGTQRNMCAAESFGSSCVCTLISWGFSAPSFYREQRELEPETSVRCHSIWKKQLLFPQFKAMRPQVCVHRAYQCSHRTLTLFKRK